MKMGCLSKVWVALAVLLLTTSMWKLFKILVWRPYAFSKWFGKQGIKGPTYSFMSGSTREIKAMKEMASNIIFDSHAHHLTPRILPHYHKWATHHGDVFTYWFGIYPRLCITEPELAKEVLSDKSGFCTKIKTRPIIAALLGKGLIFVDGSDWVRHRKVVGPAFNMNKLKVMTKRMASCTLSMLDSWKHQANGQDIEVEMNGEFRELTADIIAHTAFGISFIEGKEVFQVQKEIQQRAIASITDIFIPGTHYLPTKWNIDTWKLERRLKKKLKHIIESRLSPKDPNPKDIDSGYGDDLLGLMLGLSTSDSGRKQVDVKLNMDEIMDECKTFFFAGHETTANSLTWTMFLLSLYKEWQEKLREEVLRECGQETPDPDKLSKLKLMNMVLLESLRLYPPVITLFRNVTKDMKLGDLMIPEGTTITIPLAMVHRNKEWWGEDVNEFNPLRFANGISRAATHPNALVAFSVGPRACIGQNFAMLESKMAIAMILQRFSFSLSPKYKHAPADRLTLQPQFGLPVLLKPLHV